ncbi:MAG: outer membrane beta-barrel protein [Verrucomicrobiia bacterium]
MKKLITSASLAVLGAASVNAQQVYAPAPGLTSTQLAKPWSVSAAVRGFYDDNYALTPSAGLINPRTGERVKPQESWGYELTPSAALNWTMDQTYLGLSYLYSFKYFEDRADNKYDQTHRVDFKLSHAFSDRYKLDLADSFVKTREPDLIAPGNAPNSTIRTRQDVLRNYGTAAFSAGLTDQLSTLIGYSNTLYDFDDSGTGSLSALLDRMEHLATVNLRWQALPNTVALVGYNFGLMDFTGDENTLILNPNRPPGGFLNSDERNQYSHYAYVGADHSFNPQLDTSVRVGAQFTEYYNLPGEDESDVSPYADANLTYRMTPDSSAQIGVRHSRIATDGAALDQENTTVYGSVSYRILPPLTASLLGQYQYNTFEEGQPSQVAGVTFKDQSENFWLVGLNLTYEINRFLAAEAGYNYDHLDSDLGFRSFTRNRVYVGLRATY